MYVSCIDVYFCVTAYMCASVHAHVEHMWREGGVGMEVFLDCFESYSLSHLNSEFAVRASQPSSGITGELLFLSIIYMGSGDPNSSPHA